MSLYTRARAERDKLEAYRVAKDANASYLNRLLTDGEADYSWEILQARGRLDTAKMVDKYNNKHREDHTFKLFGIAMTSLAFFILGLPVISIYGLFATAFLAVIAYHFDKHIHLLVAVMVISTLIGAHMAWVDFIIWSSSPY